ncbi:hypothetical protein KC355_g4822 [Hortaea werneckii]|nr:hypothetical protein KC355_g4822 [Hortaea werneckii]
MFQFTSLVAMATLAMMVEGYNHPFKHVAVDAEVRRRQAMMTPASVPATITPAIPGVIAVITPSPGASPVTVSSQSQIVTSYVPQYTLCELPPIEFFSISPVPLASRPTTAPYRNYSISIPPGNGTCTTIYSETQTMVCDTTLSDLVTTYHVTHCAQEITFSTEYGYRFATPTPTADLTNATYPFPNGTNPLALRPVTGSAPATITPAPTIQNLTTYWMAPWHELTAATAPADVTKKVCFTHANGTSECVTEYEVWHTSLVTEVATSTLSVNLTTMIHGPSAVVYEENIVANVTEFLTTVSITTTMEKEYETEWTSTLQDTATISTGPTVYQTLTVEEASMTDDTTRTTTIRSTSTIYRGTITVTASPGAPELPPVYL